MITLVQSGTMCNMESPFSSIYRVFRKTGKSFDAQYIPNFLGYRSIWHMNQSPLSWRVCVHMVFMWMHVQYKIPQPCELAVNKPWSCQLCYTTCHLWSLQQQFQFPLATPEQCTGWCSTDNRWRKYLQRIVSSEHSGQDHPHLKWSENWFDTTQLPSTSCRTSKMTFTVCEHIPSYWKNAGSTYPPTRMSFCSSCRYCWML